MPAKSPRAKAGSSSKADAVDLTLSSEDNEVTAPKSKAATTSKANPSSASNGKSPAVNGSGKRKAIVADDDDESDQPIKPLKKRSSASLSSTAPRKKRARVEDDDDDYADAGGLNEDEEMIDAADEKDDEVPFDMDEPFKPAKKAAAKKATPKNPTASTSSAGPVNGKTSKQESEPAEEKPKYKWQPKPSTGPMNPGSKLIPEGAPGALDGLTLVFTGEMESLAREEAQSLAKRYGAKVTSSVSSKTSYVVLGEGAGPKKLETIAKNSIKTLDEDGFLKLIATRGAKDLDKKFVEKQKEEDKKIKQAAQSMKLDPNLGKTALWTVKYAPQNVKELCGNPGAVEKLQKWLDAWPRNLRSNFNKPGADGSGMFRAVLIYGPPGIGKTTSAHLVATLAGYKVVELNASDTRSKKLLEASLRSTVDNTVLDGFLRGEGLSSSDAVNLSDRSVLIMDEVDGTSAGDRGGIGALNALIKKSKVPIICIANDKSSQKMKPLLNTTFQIQFKRPEAASVRARLMTIAFKEGMKIDRTVADQLVAGTQSDIRQMINIMSTWSLNSKTMTYDETKRMTDTRDSNSLSTPFVLMDKLFGPYAWSQNHRTKLNDKLEVYFQEFDVMPLFVQENYLKHKYSRVPQSLNPRKASLQKAQITSKAADCISDGDLVDRMIHGTQQHWTLMPVHGMLSTVLPSYHCYGAGGYGGGNWGSQDGMGSARSFPGWFGKNSTQGRLQRALTEIQIRMRLKVSGDRREIRQSYIPTLFHTLVEPLANEGNEAIESIIDGMDQYYLTKEEWDALVELGIGDNAGEPMLKKIKPTTKTAFTRKYNTGEHPIPFHKATEIGASKRIAAESQKPDLEEAFDVDVVPEGDDEDTKPKKAGEEDTIKDKLVKAKKPKAEKKPAVKKEAGAKGKV